MRKEIRRIIMFCTILTVGLLLLFIDVTLIQLLFLIIAIAIILPFLLGLVTIAEVRTTFETFKEERLKKISILKKLDEIKLFEKTGPAKPGVAAPKVPVKPTDNSKKSTLPAITSGTPAKMPFSSQIETVLTSLKSLGTILKERTKRERKVSDINTMLDKTISEKVGKTSTPAAVAPVGNTTLPAPGGSGSSPAADADPFLSLSGDEFDAGLLDGLDDDIAMPAPSGGSNPSDPGASPDNGLPEPELSMPDLELDSAAADILKANEGDEGPDGFGSPEAGGGADTDFGDLENLSLDDIDLDAELGDEMDPGESPAAPPSAADPATPPSAPAASAETSSAVKTAWIPSDAPKGADQEEDQVGTQADMASFASASGGSDEDLLSSIASDVKHTTKEKDLSLLRELKDFKAPANEIETELTDLYQKMNTIQKPKDKVPPATNGMK